MKGKKIIFNEWKLDPIGELLGTGFNRFRSDCFKLDGLARVKGPRLDILAVISDKPGEGNFRKFIIACKRQYVAISIWEIQNPWVAKVLKRYGFKEVAEIIFHSKFNLELTQGYRWIKPIKPKKGFRV